MYPAARDSKGTTLRARLQARRPEMEQAMLARVYGISDPTGLGDPQYIDGLRATVSAAIDYALASLEQGEERAPPIPAALLTQVRLAARSSVGLETVLRRYFAGYALLADLVVEEAEATPDLGRPDLQRLLRIVATLFDRIVGVVAEEYVRESRLQPEKGMEHRAERVRRLLDGELLDTSELGYPLDFWHLGVIATGADAPASLRRLASVVDRIVLLVHPHHDVVWAWLGGRRPFDLDPLLSELSTAEAASSRFAIGEPAEGLAGWRLTHRQAGAALPIALRSAEPIVRYADVALLASTLQDDLLISSLRQLYLDPLENERDGGAALRETLRAYLSSRGSLSAAAEKLSVSRRTISNRLMKVEERVGRPLHTALAEIETALRLEELDDTDIAEDLPDRAIQERMARSNAPP